jgi:uncharacterized protein with LGFP repeats
MSSPHFSVRGLLGIEGNKSGRNKTSSRRRKSQRSLRLESLEQRQLMSVSPGVGHSASAAGAVESRTVLTTDIANPVRRDAIQQKWVSLGGESGFLGKAVAREQTAPDGVGRYQDFAGGSIYWSSTTGAHVLEGDIRSRWLSLGGLTSNLGYPTTDELTAPDGSYSVKYNHFQHGSIYFQPGHLILPIIDPISGANLGGGGWSPATTFVVENPIEGKYASLGWETCSLGLPTSDTLTTPDGIGRYVHFRNGSIYWSPATGAHTVWSAVETKWASLGWEKGYLGYPTSDTSATTQGGGKFNDFQGGSIYYKPATGTHVIKGAIRDEWKSLGAEKSQLGFPLTDELTTPDGIGRYNHFENGSIYWTPSTGAHEVLGSIKAKWASMGWEKSLLGYPVVDEIVSSNGVWHYSRFQNGGIKWSAATGAVLTFNRDELLRVFQKVEADGVVTASELTTLRSWVADKTHVDMPSYVRVLANKTLNHDAANATYNLLNASGNTYQVALGDMYAGASSTLLIGLANKWFRGMDYPVTTYNTGQTQNGQPVYSTPSYSLVSNRPLFSNGVNYYDVSQGAIGDCWLLASIAAVAARNPSIFQNNTFIVNSDGTTTVRFFHNGVADYVTVDNFLPNGGSIFDSITHTVPNQFTTANRTSAPPNQTFETETWVALLERAYAQENAEGWLASNTHSSNGYQALNYISCYLAGADQVLAALTGLASSNVNLNATDLTSAWNSGKMIAMGTSAKHTLNGANVVRGHVYAVVGYDATTKKFTIYNPWGLEGGTYGQPSTYAAGLLTATGQQIAGAFSYGAKCGAVAAAAAADSDSHRASRTAVLEAAFAALPPTLEESVIEKAQWIGANSQTDRQARSLLFANDLLS